MKAFIYYIEVNTWGLKVGMTMILVPNNSKNFRYGNVELYQLPFDYTMFDLYKKHDTAVKPKTMTELKESREYKKIVTARK
ncbi:MAG: hypothetical protein COA42_23235 [Alteromonadaceae bacterium]|nr:MAG: hypothetical protein COA42_23235 [Alteromonadaceae bacterium]